MNEQFKIFNKVTDNGQLYFNMAGEWPDFTFFVGPEGISASTVCCDLPLEARRELVEVMRECVTEWDKLHHD